MITLEAAQTLRGKASVASKVTVSVFGMELSGTTETYKLLAQTQPGTGVATFYTVPGSTVAFIRSVHVVNTDSAARTFKFYVGGAVDANALTPDISVPAGGLAVYDSDGWAVYDSNGNLMTTVATGLPSGAAGGELAGTYPNPTVTVTHSGSAHHAQAHDHSAAGDGQSLAPASTFVLGGDITPAQITSTQNDYAPAGITTAAVLRLNTDASRSITGIASANIDGQVLVIANVGANDIVFQNQNTGSAAANRFRFGKDLTLAPDSAFIIQYDGTTSRWRSSQLFISQTDGEHTISSLQVLAGTDAGAAQKGHVQLAGELSGTAAAPTVTATHSGSAHHVALTIGIDGSHSLVGQVLSGVVGTVGQVGHLAFDGTAPTDTVAGAASAPGSATTAARRDHLHRTSGIVAAIASDVAVANTETQVVGFTVPANLLAVGSSFRIYGAGTGTSGATGGTGIFRIRIGTTTLTGNIVTTVSPANVANQTNQGFTFEANITVRTIGAGGTIIGHSADQGRVMFNLAEIQSVDVAAVAVDTTASKILELTYISGNAGTTLTFKVAYILWL